MREIGGYNTFSNNYYKNTKISGFSYNLARNAIRHFASTISAKRVYCPNFTCASVKQALTSIGTDILYYNLTDNFTPDIREIEKDSVLILNNYFGQTKTNIIEYLEGISDECFHVLIDNSHSIEIEENPKYSEVFSLRKFLGLTDGALLKTEKSRFKKISEDYELLPCDRSAHRVEWLFHAEEGKKCHSYNEYLKFRADLQNLPVRKMSNTTKLLVSAVGLDDYIKQRKKHFLQAKNFLHDNLPGANFFMNIHNPLGIGVPLRVKNTAIAQRELAEHSLYCAYYWPELRNQLRYRTELNLIEFLVLPLDVVQADEEQLDIIRKHII